MDRHLAHGLARELDKTCAALAAGGALLQGIDRIVAALALAERERYSALRTAFEQALSDTQRVQQVLRDEGPSGSHPDWPLAT